MRRIILHCDLNCFYASVEMLYHPKLRNVPMAVAGSIEERHGIILAKNPLAKKRGVKTAETIAEALKKCPELVLCEPRYDDYRYFSHKVRDLYYEYTDRIESFGADECWLDITESIPYFGSIARIVTELLSRVKEEIGLTLSIGVSFNKIYAKLGSDLAVEDSYRVIESIEDIRGLPSSALLGVGKSTYEQLKRYHLDTIGDIADSSPVYLTKILGKWGEELYHYATGNYDSEVRKIDDVHREVKSIGNSSTGFRDLRGESDVRLMLKKLCENVAERARRQGFYFRTVHLSLRDSDLKKTTCQTVLKENSDLAKDIFENAWMLFLKNGSLNKSYRSIGVSVSTLSHEKDASEISLDGTIAYREKDRNGELAIEEIRRRFGRKAVSSLRFLEDRRLADLEEEDE